MQSRINNNKKKTRSLKDPWGLKCLLEGFMEPPYWRCWTLVLALVLL